MEIIFPPSLSAVTPSFVLSPPTQSKHRSICLPFSWHHAAACSAIEPGKGRRRRFRLHQADYKRRLEKCLEIKEKYITHIRTLCVINNGISP
jgi:hypothetical protein